MNQRDAKKIRQRLLDRGLPVIVYLGEGVFGKGAANTSAIIVCAPVAFTDSVTVGDLSSYRETERPRALQDLSRSRFSELRRLCRADPDTTFFVSNIPGAALLTRLREEHKLLKDALAQPIARGVTPDCVRGHVLSDSDQRELGIEDGILRASVSGRAVSRDGTCIQDQWIIYTAKGMEIGCYPKALEYLDQYRDQITCREVAAGKHPWWALHRPRKPAIFDSPKLIGVTTSTTIRLGLDLDRNLYVTDALYVIHPNPSVDPSCLLAVMESRVFLFLYRMANQSEARVIPQVKAAKLGDLPLPLDACRKVGGNAKLLRCAQDLVQLRGETSRERERKERLIRSITTRIDQIVYELYGLTDAEIGIVEEATK